MYYVDKNFLGTKDHLVASSSGLIPVAEPGGDLLVEDGTSDPGTLKSFLRIVGSNIDIVPSEVKRSNEVCGIPAKISGLAYQVRSSELQEMLFNFYETTKAHLRMTSRYIPFYLENIQTLNSCANMKFADGFTGVHVCDQGFANKVVYDTTGTKTGRMSVVSGPNVLTLPKGFKEQLLSRHTRGKIVEIDFSSLEPRTALATAGSSFALASDIYSELGKLVGISDREVMKQLVISFLYGAGLGTTKRLTGMDEQVLRPKLKELSAVFARDIKVREIRQSMKDRGHFYNHAGRMIFPNSDKPGLLFNNYCQSTAVDVALSGFGNLLARIKKEGLSALPLCFIHDAILLDVPEAELHRLTELSSKLPTYLGVDFPTKLTVVNN